MKRCHGGLFARPARPCVYGLKKACKKAHLAPARFASECEVRCFASAMPVRSMRPRAGSEHEHSIVDSVSAHQPKSKSAATHRLPMWLRSACSDAGGMTIPVRSSSAHARDSQFGLPQGGSGLRRPTTTFLEVSLTSCWRRPGQWMWRGGLTAMHADARSLHVRLWEGRCRQARGFRRFGAIDRVLMS